MGLDCWDLWWVVSLFVYLFYVVVGLLSLDALIAALDICMGLA